MNTTPVAADRTLLYLRLARIPGFGPILVKRCLDALGSPEAVLTATASRLAAIEDIGPKRAEAFARARDATAADAQREFEEATRLNVAIITPEHPDWPPGLRNIPDPPILLYVRGRLEPGDALAVAVVGARHCTLYGREQAERFGALLAQNGLTVVSGGARGIDTGAHEGALRAKGRTLVIQGCGLANNYPPENAGLYQRVVDGDAGAILSELPLATGPLAENFPPRNRIITALSLGVLVVEATQRSGSLITARLAADDYGREVFALPGRVDSAASAGTHHLIKTGCAHLVENVADILDALGDTGVALRRLQPAPPAMEPRASVSGSPPDRPIVPASVDNAATSDVPSLFADAPVKLTPPQQKLLAALDADAVTVDDLCDRTALPAAVVMAELTMLQIRGLIQRAGPNRFALRKKG